MAELATLKYSGAEALKEAFACTITAGNSKVRGQALPFRREDLENYLTEHRNEEAIGFG
jgi:hypothetical protein